MVARDRSQRRLARAAARRAGWRLHRVRPHEARVVHVGRLREIERRSEHRTLGRAVGRSHEGRRRDGTHLVRVRLGCRVRVTTHLERLASERDVGLLALLQQPAQQQWPLRLLAAYAYAYARRGYVWPAMAELDFICFTYYDHT
eukprot:scaffold35300_cov63-Phaeocystis_antarctica.AAC.2